MSRKHQRGVYCHARNHQLSNDLQHFVPVRKVISRTTKRVVGRFPSSKSGRTVSWESQIERDFLHLLETDHDVADFVEQPEQMHLVIDGELHAYVPDFLVWSYEGQSWFAEVKPDDEAESQENKALFAAAAEACLQRNMGYCVLVESWIRTEPRLGNAKLLGRYKKANPELEIVLRAVALLEEREMSLGALREALGGHAQHQDVMALLFRGQIAVDMSYPLTDESQLWLPGLGGRR